MLDELGENVRARINAQGALVEADPRFLNLQRLAGGTATGVIAIPQIAAVAHLAQTLGVPISRNIIAGESANDLALHVSAQPIGKEVVLTITGWHNARRAGATLGLTQCREDALILWQADARLIITEIYNTDFAESYIGAPLEQLFLLQSIDGNFPILRGIAEQRSFKRQPALWRQNAVELSGVPVMNSSDSVIGWRGSATIQRDNCLALPFDVSEQPPLVVTDAPFTGLLSRRLRAPLDIIIEQADGLCAGQGEPLASRYRDYAQDIAAAARHLLALVDDLNDLQQIESPDFTVEREEIDLADVVRRAASLLSVRAHDQGVGFDLPHADECLIVIGDFRRSLQILLNLMGNALRYAPAQSKVWVRLEAEAGLAALIIADQGKGIDAENHQRIFQKFMRIDTSEPGGSGLGLFIARRLAQAMGGDITLDSAPGQGARFILTLPQAQTLTLTDE